MVSNGNYGARKMSRDVGKEAFGDKKLHFCIGVVRLFDGETSHFEMDGEDLVVDVELTPEGLPCLCRMACIAGGPGRGIWAVPPVGTEVVVAIPLGEIDCDPVIVGCLSTMSVPEGVDELTLVINSPKIKIVSTGGDIVLASSNNVRLGSEDADHPAPRGDTLREVLNNVIALLNAHVHSGGTISGSTGVPVVMTPSIGTDVLSDKVKVS